MKKTSVILAVVIAALFVLALFPSFASAAGGISVSPAVYDQAVTNGQQLKPITVVNSGSATERVTVGIVGVGQDVKQGSILLTDQATASGLEACFEITPRDFELPPGGQKQVSVRVKTETKPGGIYAAFLVKATPSKAEGETSISANTQAAIIALLHTPGAAPLSGQVMGMVIGEITEPLTKAEKDAAGKGTALPYRLDVAPVVKNTGNTHFLPTGYVIVRTEKGEELGRPALEGATTVLPGYERALRTIWQPGAPLPDGKYQTEAHVLIGPGQEITFADTFLMNQGRLARRKGEIKKVLPETVPPGPVSLRLVIANTGNIPYKPTLTLKITDPATGAVVADNKDFKVDTSILKANQRKTFTAKSYKKLKEKSYTLAVVLSYQPVEKGKPTFEDTQLNTYEGNLLVKAPPSIWATMWNWLRYNWWIIVLVLGIILAGVAVFLLIRHYRKKTREMEKRIEKLKNGGEKEDEDTEVIAPDKEEKKIGNGNRPSPRESK